MWFRRKHDREAFEALATELEQFAASLPSSVQRDFERSKSHVFLQVKPPTHAHRTLIVDANTSSAEYELGRIWTENMALNSEVTARILAACDAVRAGAVREVKDRESGLLYHVYKFRTRGLEEFVRDSQYSAFHFLRQRPKHVHIHTLPALVETTP